MAKILDTKWRSQRDNDYDSYSGNGPDNTCSYTSMAVALNYYGIIGNGQGQLEDQIERTYSRLGLTKGLPEDMAYFINKYYSPSIRATATRKATKANIKKALDNNCPVIVHTYLTHSGHVVTIVGYDDTAYNGKGAFIVEDSWGEFTNEGYINKSGHQLPYSYNLMDLVAGPDGNYWIEVVSKA